MSNLTNFTNHTFTNSTQIYPYENLVIIWINIIISLTFLFFMLAFIIAISINRRMITECFYIHIVYRFYPATPRIYPLPSNCPRDITPRIQQLKKPDGVIIVQPDSNIAFGANIH